MIPTTSGFSSGFDAGFGGLPISRPSLNGTVFCPYGPFDGKAGTVVEEVAAPTGAGSGAKRRRPRRRRISIDGRLYTVESVEEELALLEAYRQRLQARADREQPAPEKRKARIKLKRVEKRIDAAEARAQRLAAIAADDDEVLVLYATLH